MLQEKEKMATMGWRYASSKYVVMHNISWSGHALILSKCSSKALQSSVLFCLVRTESHCGVCCLCVWWWSWSFDPDWCSRGPPTGKKQIEFRQIYFTSKSISHFRPGSPCCQWQFLEIPIYIGFDKHTSQLHTLCWNTNTSSKYKNIRKYNICFDTCTSLQDGSPYPIWELEQL